MEKENQLDNIKKIYNDYFSIFLSNEFIDINYSQLYLVLSTLVKKRYEDKKENFIKDVSKAMLWIESNSKYIYMILDIFNKIQQYKENLFDIITRIIDNRENNLEVSERSPE